MGVVKDFEGWFGRRAQATATAPGRVNLIGEHTDYNDGFVLPTVIPQSTEVWLAAREDGVVRAASSNLSDGEIERYLLGEETRRGGWIDYVQGVTRALRENGHRVPGFDAAFHSSVPIGSGVSSSAALQVALLRALRRRFALPLDDLAIARLAQQSENELVGARVGIMDPMASSLGLAGSALFIDTRALTWMQVPIPPSVELVVVDSGVSHRHAGGEYNRRRSECEEACARLGIRSLRDLEVRDLPRARELPAPLDRRVRHVVTENRRVIEAVRALEEDRPEELGRLLDASHASLRDDYEVSIPELDALVTSLRREPTVFGARMTGGGFGGAVVAIARRDMAHVAAGSAARRYAAESGRTPTVLVPHPTVSTPAAIRR